jgi:predicted ribosome quality control (RQC) complex YloA/Tae2 family protein
VLPSNTVNILCGTVGVLLADVTYFKNLYLYYSNCVDERNTLIEHRTDELTHFKTIVGGMEKRERCMANQKRKLEQERAEVETQLKKIKIEQSEARSTMRRAQRVRQKAEAVIERFHAIERAERKNQCECGYSLPVFCGACVVNYKPLPTILSLTTDLFQ